MGRSTSTTSRLRARVPLDLGPTTCDLVSADGPCGRGPSCHPIAGDRDVTMMGAPDLCARAHAVKTSRTTAALVVEAM